MPQDPKDVEIARKIAPACAAFSQAMADAGLETSALIYSPDGEFLIRAGNCKKAGAEFVRLHYYLALVIAQLDAMGERHDLSDLAEAAGTNAQAAQESALKLALACITVPSDMMPRRIREFAEEYLKATGEK